MNPGWSKMVLVGIISTIVHNLDLVHSQYMNLTRVGSLAARPGDFGLVKEIARTRVKNWLTQASCKQCVSNLAEKKGGRNHPLPGKQLEIVVERVAAPVVPVQFQRRPTFAVVVALVTNKIGSPSRITSYVHSMKGLTTVQITLTYILPLHNSSVSPITLCPLCLNNCLMAPLPTLYSLSPCTSSSFRSLLTLT